MCGFETFFVYNLKIRTKVPTTRALPSNINLDTMLKRTRIDLDTMGQVLSISCKRNARMLTQFEYIYSYHPVKSFYALGSEGFSYLSFEKHFRRLAWFMFM